MSDLIGSPDFRIASVAAHLPDDLFPLLAPIAPALYSTCKALRSARHRMARSATLIIAPGGFSTGVDDAPDAGTSGPGLLSALSHPPFHGLESVTIYESPSSCSGSSSSGGSITRIEDLGPLAALSTTLTKLDCRFVKLTHLMDQPPTMPAVGCSQSLSTCLFPLAGS